MIIILIAAAVDSAITSSLLRRIFADVIIIVAVVLINAVLGVVQRNSEQAIAALRRKSLPPHPKCSVTDSSIQSAVKNWYR